jgi:putative FmdB family regulatory protein
MPTYEYRREDGTTFTVQQSISADALKECPETGQSVERLISGGGGVLVDSPSASTSNGADEAPANGAPCCGPMCGL